MSIRLYYSYTVFNRYWEKKFALPILTVIRVMILEEPLEAFGKLKIVWGKNWAKTDKRKKRYEHYQGDKMYSFFGTIKEFKQQQNHEDTWQGENS